MSVADERAERLAKEPLRNISVQQGLWSGTWESMKDLWSRRQLLALLVRREIRAKYKNSALGLLWSLIRPLIQLLIYYVVIGKFLRVGQGIPYFVILLYSGLVLWSLFQEIVAMGTSSILANVGIVKKTRLPREVFPLASVGSALFNFAIQLVILIALVLITSGFTPGINFFHLPLAILVVLIWGTAFAFLLSALNVYYRDVQYLTEVALMIGFYASPIIYPWSWVQSYFMGMASGSIIQEIYLANPLTLAVMGMQRVLWNGDLEMDTPFIWPSFLGYRLLIALVVGLIVLWFSQRVFSRLQRNFAQEL